MLKFSSFVILTISCQIALISLIHTNAVPIQATVLKNQTEVNDLIEQDIHSGHEQKKVLSLFNNVNRENRAEEETNKGGEEETNKGGQEETNKGGQEETNKGGQEETNKGDENVLKVKSDAKTNKHKELTVSIPKFRKDQEGNWVQLFYGATFGKIWRDTRFNNDNNPLTIFRMRVEQKLVTDYYPGRKPAVSVCIEKSTIYNKPIVYDWLKRNIYNGTHYYRAIWRGLRREMYTQSRSEECHTTDILKWRDYIECALRRNQRLEYLIPKYPLHQVGYRGYFTLWKEYKK